MKKDNQKIIPVEELGIHFDDRKVYDLDQKLFNGEITFEEYCQAIDQAWVILLCINILVTNTVGCGDLF